MINGIRFDDQNTGNVYGDPKNQIQQVENNVVERSRAGEQISQNNPVMNENTQAGLGVEYAVRTALEEAGLAVNERNQGIVRQMLDNQMSIGRESLNRIITQSNIFREADISTLLLMNKNNIPVTHFTAAQLQAYINNEQNLSEQIGNSINGLTEFLGDEVNSGVVSSNLEVLELLTADTEISSENMSAYGNAGNALNAQVIENDQTTMNMNAEETVLSSVMTGQGGGEAVFAAGAGQIVPLEDRNAVLNMLQTSSVNNVVDGLGTDAEGSGANWMNGFGSDNDGLNEFDEYNTGKGGNGLSGDTLSKENDGQKGTPVSELLNENEIKELNQINERLFGNGKSFDIKQSAEQILKEIYKETENADESKLKDLFSSEIYKKMLKSALNDRFTLKESDIDSADSINKFYKETFSTLSRLSEIAEKNEALTDKLSKPMDNIKFMDTLNNVFPYIQLPLKLNEGNTHGELYVFKKGRSKVNENDTQSVLLHLDMDNLGATDIHMELKTGFLKLRFYCSNEESRVLLSDNFSELEEALGNKGFNVGSEFTVRTADTANIVEALSGGSENVPEFKYNFDIRA